MSPNISRCEIPPDAESGCDLLHMPTVFCLPINPDVSGHPLLQSHCNAFTASWRATTSGEQDQFSGCNERISTTMSDATSDKPTPAGTDYRGAKDMPEMKG
jgi:hypothetical protein